MKRLSFMVIFLVICVALVFPAAAQENPFLKAGDITPADVPAEISGDVVVTSDTSSVTFEGSGYTHKIGRVSISLQPLIEGLDKNPVSSGNIRTSGMGNTIKYEVYRDLIKETVTLNSPGKLVYSYDLGLSDWVTVEPDMSRPEINYDENKTEIVMYPYTKEVTNYAKESTIEIDIDPWGNLIVYVNGEDVVVMPRPFAVDASGKHFDLDFELDRNAGTITVAGDLVGAKYPIVIDPTERVTNGGFETGDKSGWMGSYYDVVSDGPYEGTYCLYVYGSWGCYTTLSQNIDYTGVSTVSNAVEFRQENRYDIPMSNAAIQGFHWLINAPGQYVQDWTVRSTTPCLSGTGSIVIWTYSTTCGYVDSVHAIATEPIVADFTATPTSGTRPLTVQFTDTSTGSPTSWLWDFGDYGTSELQNPQYTYTEPGCYDVKLTVENCAENDTETKGGCIIVTGHYYVYADGVSLYHGYEGNLDLTYANRTAWDFYTNISGKVGTVVHSIEWEGLANPVDDATGSRNWDINEDANSMANNADFAYHAGHGWEDGILFGTANPDYKLYRSDMEFGGNNGRAKWVVLDSCHVLDQSIQSNWESVFNGLHILMGFDTEGRESKYRGVQFAERMTGTGTYPAPVTISEAWEYTLRNTINNPSIKGAYMWAEPCKNDYLPGFGTFSKPVKNSNGQYTINWTSFECN